MITVLQHSTGHHVGMTRMTQQFHQNYCVYHGYDYRIRHDRRAPNNPMWDKLPDMMEWAASAGDGDMCIWMDADTLWRDPFFPLAEALEPDKDVGMVPMNIGYLNTGIIFLRRSIRVVQYLTKVYEGNGPGRKPTADGKAASWQDQSYFNHELIDEFSDLKVQELDSRFNSFKYQLRKPTGKIVVKAWHAERLQCAMKCLAAECVGLPMLACPPRPA